MRLALLIIALIGALAAIFVAAQTEAGRAILWLLISGGDGS